MYKYILIKPFIIYLTLVPHVPFPADITVY